MTILNLGDSVTTSDGETGEVVGILTKPSADGFTRIILAGGGIYCCREDGTGRFFHWTKAKKKVKGTVYLNIYRSGNIYKHDTKNSAEISACWNNKTAIAIAVPAEYEYETDE